MTATEEEAREIIEALGYQLFRLTIEKKTRRANAAQRALERLLKAKKP